MRNFSNLIFLIFMEMYDNSDVVLISTVFGTREHVDCRKVFWSKAFWTFK